MNPSRRLFGCRRGAAAVEFAMVAPMLILLILGTVETGYAMFTKSSISRAVGQTVRWAHTMIEADLSEGTEAQVRSYLMSLAPGVPLASEHIAVSYEPVGGGCANTEIVVTVTYPYDSLATTIVPIGPITFTETRRTPLQCWPRS